MKILKQVLILLGIGSPWASAELVLFHNGNILKSWTPSPQWASEMLVQDGKIISLGSRLPRSPETRLWDLKRKWVVPAFTDSHAHLLETGRQHFQLDLRGMSLQQIRELVQQALAQKIPVERVVGFGWDQTLWNDQKFPTRDFLDQISRKIPIILYRVDGHAVWINSVAHRLAGLSKAESNGSSTPGVFVDLGMEKINRLIPEDSEEAIKNQIRSVVKKCLSLGITGLHDAGISSREYQVLKALIQEENLPFRFYEMASFQDLESLKETVLNRRPEMGLFRDKLTLRTVKFYLDGAMGSRGALFDEPYADAPETRGLQLMETETLKKAIQAADQAGFQVAIHAIGNRANRMAVDLLESVFGTDTRRKRPRIEHAQILDPTTIEKMGRLGIIASMQPTHCPSDSRWILTRIGKKRTQYAYPWKSLLNVQTPLAFGSDSPIEAFDPWLGLFSATTRMRPEGHPAGGFLPNEKIPLTEAWQAYTSGAAYSAFQENILGQLAPGYWADFILLDENPLKLKSRKILRTQVHATFVAGHQAFP
ncbi:hypothetical protein EBR03_01095 [bacterium]|nr:hypothetical protein [bacterium]